MARAPQGDPHEPSFLLNILGISYDEAMEGTETIMAPGSNITMEMEQATHEPFYRLCEVAGKVSTTWFALTANYDIVKAPVSVQMEGQKPVVLWRAAQLQGLHGAGGGFVQH